MGIAAYAITKTAMLGLVKGLAGSLAKDNIRYTVAFDYGILRIMLANL